MRKRPNLQPRLDNCAGLIVDNGEERRGKWLVNSGINEKPNPTETGNYRELWLELGCGKGRFTADTAEANPTALLIAVEKVADAMVIATERARDRKIENLRFINGDVSALPELFGFGEVSRIFINFCDPWPKSRDAKFRLTAPSFLRLYADALSLGGDICFKTDNTPLFDWSMEQFEAEGWELKEKTHDLHADGPVGIMTDYEAKFYAEGLKINSLRAVKTEKTLKSDAGALPRLRNASLKDARGYELSQGAKERE